MYIYVFYVVELMQQFVLNIEIYAYCAISYTYVHNKKIRRSAVCIALHGYLLSFPHPVTRKKITFTAEPPKNKSSSLWMQLLSHEDSEFIANYIRQQAELIQLK